MNIFWNPEKYLAPELPESLADRLHDLIPAHPTLGHRLNRIVRLELEDPEETHRLLFRLYTYFNRTFRKAIGKTPSEYRKHFDPAKDS